MSWRGGGRRAVPGMAGVIARPLIAHAILEPYRVVAFALHGRRCAVLVAAAARQALEERDEVDELDHAEAVGVARHDRFAVGPGEAGAVDDDGVRRQDRLREVLRRVHAPHAGQRGADVLRVGRGGTLRKALPLDRVALEALELGEELPALRGIA